MSKHSRLFSLCLLLIFSLLSGCATPTQDATSTPYVSTTYLVTVESCGEPITFESTPERALFVRQAKGHSLEGQWSIQWGVADPGELPDTTALRETLEEGEVTAKWRDCLVFRTCVGQVG